jgi:DNA-binding MarR family transcriptional regulator
MVWISKIVHVTRKLAVDPMIDTIINDFRATMNELKGATSERLLRQGVSMAQLNILYMLQRNGEMIMSQVADVLNVSFSNATGLVDRMEERGVIERIRIPEDRRIVVVRLTPAGGKLLDEVDALNADLLRRVFSGFDSTQLETMGHAIANLRTAVEAAIAAAPDHHHTPNPIPRSPSTMRGAEGSTQVATTAQDLARSQSRRD